MIVIEGLKSDLRFENLVLTVGSFDGVHRGHQILLERLRSVADSIGGVAGVLTFEPHPRRFLSPDDDTIRLITTSGEKLRQLELAGVDVVFVVPFTEEFSRTTSEAFIRDVLIKELDVKCLVVGYDHHFGRGRKGSSEDLKKFGLRIENISEEDIDDIAISSTRIRRALVNGNVKLASMLLGHNYSVSGRVVRGNQLGRTMGFPTANLEIEDVYMLIEHRGVYAVKVEVEGVMYSGMCNIGVRPTFNLSDVIYEVNIFDFDKDIYGEEIRIEFIDKTRDEMKFDSKEELMAQLKSDMNVVKLKIREYESPSCSS